MTMIWPRFRHTYDSLACDTTNGWVMFHFCYNIPRSDCQIFQIRLSVLCDKGFIHAHLTIVTIHVGFKSVTEWADIIIFSSQVEYEAEGIEWSSVSFVDNQECLDLVAKKPTGLLQLLDEECRYVQYVYVTCSAYGMQHCNQNLIKHLRVHVCSYQRFELCTLPFVPTVSPVLTITHCSRSLSGSTRTTPTTAHLNSSSRTHSSPSCTTPARSPTPSRFVHCTWLSTHTMKFLSLTTLYRLFVHVQGFREKNRDLMRSDIVNVLQASRMDLVRALIGLPPYTVYRWQMAYLKVIAVFAFR